MRSVIISIAIAVVMVVGSVIYTVRLENISEQMLTYSERIEENIQKNDFTAAKEQIAELKGFMDKRKTAMEATGNHEEIDKIEMNLCELEVYSDNEMTSDAMAKCKSLKFLLEHLPKNFKLKIENIL